MSSVSPQTGAILGNGGMLGSPTDLFSGLWRRCEIISVGQCGRCVLCLLHLLILPAECKWWGVGVSGGTVGWVAAELVSCLYQTVKVVDQVFLDGVSTVGSGCFYKSDSCLIQCLEVRIKLLHVVDSTFFKYSLWMIRFINYVFFCDGFNLRVLQATWLDACADGVVH